MYKPSIKQLSYLLAIRDHESFLAASQFCNVTQSTLSAGIQEIENKLEQTLIVRGRKKASLTSFGHEVATQAEEILARIDNIVSRAQILNEPLSGPLRLGIIPTIAPYMLPTMLSRLAKEFPKLELQIIEDLTERLLDQLKKGLIDVALMAFPYDTPGMTQMLMFEEYFYAAFAEFQVPQTQILNINEIEPDRLLLLEDGHCIRDHALQACNLQPSRNRKIVSATSLPTLIQMVRAGLGITLLPEMACNPDTIPQGIKLLRLEGGAIPTRQIGLCWRRKDAKRESYELLAKTLT